MEEPLCPGAAVDAVARANAVDAAVARAARPAKRKKQPHPYEIVHALLTFFARWS